jgi:hypothetical protein
MALILSLQGRQDQGMPALNDYQSFLSQHPFLANTQRMAMSNMLLAK